MVFFSENININKIMHLKCLFDTFAARVPGGLGYDLPERFKALFNP